MSIAPPHLKFFGKLEIPSFVSLPPTIDFTSVRFSYNDTKLKYIVKKRHCKYQVILCGKIDYMIYVTASITSGTVKVFNSDWPIISRGCKRVYKVLCCTKEKPTVPRRTDAGFVGFFSAPINGDLSSIVTKKNVLCVKIVSDLTQCDNFIQDIQLTGFVRCSCPGTPPVVVTILDENGNAVATDLPLGPSNTFTSPVLPAGDYVIQYLCASDPSIVLGQKTDFYNAPESNAGSITVNCTQC
jgi:hypothetical protein